MLGMNADFINYRLNKMSEYDAKRHAVAKKYDEELKNVPVIGPGKFAAQLEGSKDFAKQFMARHNIPTAKYATFTKETLEQGYAFLEAMKPPYVLKADPPL